MKKFAKEHTEEIIWMIIIIIMVMAFVLYLKYDMEKRLERKVAFEETKEFMIDKYTVSSNEEIVIDPINYYYDKETGAEVRLVKEDNYKAIFVNMHYETIEKMGYDAITQYITSLSNDENVIYILVSCHPETRNYVFYDDGNKAIISLYSNTDYSGVVYGNNYSNPGYITFYTE